MDRYIRQTVFFGKENQNKLSNSRAGIIGLGGTGSLVLKLLSKAGTGRILAVDRDFVEISNLHREFYLEKDLGRPKALAAVESIKKENSGIEIIGKVEDLNPKTIDMLKGLDLIIDCTDNMETRFLINEFSVREGIPWIFGSAIGDEGMGAVLKGKPCLSCVFRQGSGYDTCETLGVLGPAAAFAGSWQAHNAIRALTGKPEFGKLFSFNLGKNIFEVSKIKANQVCRVCKKMVFQLLEKKTEDIAKLCGQNFYQIAGKKADLKKLAGKLQINPQFKTKLMEGILHLDFDRYKVSVFENGRAMIKGPENTVEAKAVYSRLFG